MKPQRDVYAEGTGGSEPSTPQTRPIKELLILLREQVIKQSPKKYWIFGERSLEDWWTGRTGLCSCIDKLDLGIELKLRVKDYLYAHAPVKRHNKLYFWEPGLVKPRLDWIDYHIQLNS